MSGQGYVVLGVVTSLFSLMLSWDTSTELTGVLDDCVCDIESIDVFNNFKIYPKIQKLTERDFFRYYKLTGVLDDCFCDIESIDVFNNFKIYPKIQKLTERDFFRYYKVNLRRPCPFWPDDGHCSIKNCQVEPCPESKVPVGIKAGNYNKEYCLMGDRGPQSIRTGNQKADVAPKGETDTEDPALPNAHCASSFNEKDSARYAQDTNTVTEIEDCVQANQLGAINSTLSNQSKEAFVEWARHDDAKDHFCELDDETSPDAEYVDLLFNPERYTGYKGPSAWRVWNSIYEENCFKAFPMHFDEKSMFAGGKKEAKILKEEFRLHFKNISRIMDCVGCSSCRLWGKLQTQGLGTALKILFSEKEIKNLSENSTSKDFQLTRQEIVGLLNAFGRRGESLGFVNDLHDSVRYVNPGLYPIF
ncbi:UNVERIFIED_CONTAM: hypothetical protein FKN15_013465 [Acipenser sinensis]